MKWFLYINADVRNEKIKMFGVQFKIDEMKTVL